MGSSPNCTTARYNVFLYTNMCVKFQQSKIVTIVADITIAFGSDPWVVEHLRGTIRFSL